MLVGVYKTRNDNIITLHLNVEECRNGSAKNCRNKEASLEQNRGRWNNNM